MNRDSRRKCLALSLFGWKGLIPWRLAQGKPDGRVAGGDPVRSAVRHRPCTKTTYSYDAEGKLTRVETDYTDLDDVHIDGFQRNAMTTITA